jgi:sterol desaturase/sphingolipid hydroxylase (fatty acid hydroxylase superfamily)
MISLKSLKNYININSFLLSFSYLNFLSFFASQSLFLSFITIFLRNYILVKIIDHNLKDKNAIQTKIRINPIEEYYGEFTWFMAKASVVETFTYQSLHYLELLNYESSLYDLLFFIPYSFVFEIIFDLFHYLTHRYIHFNKYLYRHTHKIHHTHNYPISIITFYQHPLDLLITNSIPTIIAIYCLPNISLFMYSMISIYKTYIEICGHTGKQTFPTSSFPQFIWLPKILQIELYTEDHDLHHTRNNCNYAKRFALWDKVFNTYQLKK